VLEGGRFALHNELGLPHGRGVPEGAVLDLVISAQSGTIIGVALPEPSQLKESAEVAVASVASRRYIAVHRVIAHTALDGPPPRYREKGQIFGRAVGGTEVFAYHNGRRVDIQSVERGKFGMSLFAGTYSLVLQRRRGHPCRVHKTVVVRDLEVEHVTLRCGK
jgi:hypothetical protein